MNSNLVTFENRTKEEQRKIATMGGKASGEARRRKKALRECLDILLEKEISKDKEGNSVSGAEAMAMKVFQMALKGNLRAWELVRDTAGQKPMDKISVSEVNQTVIDEVEQLVNGNE